MQFNWNILILLIFLFMFIGSAYIIISEKFKEFINQKETSFSDKIKTEIENRVAGDNNLANRINRLETKT